MKKLMFCAWALLAFGACSDDDEPTTLPAAETVTFETAALTDGLLTGKKLAKPYDDTDWQGNPVTYNRYEGIFYEAGAARFHCFYSDQYGDYSAGFTLSDQTDMETYGPTNQFSVYATAGAGDSKQFAVGYYDTYNKAVPTISFASAVTPRSVWIANSTYGYLYWSKDESFNPSHKVSDFYVVVTGFDGTAQTAQVQVRLADGDTGRIADTWREVDLTPLGRVDRIEFTTVSTDEMAPAYFCIDDFSYSTSL